MWAIGLEVAMLLVKFFLNRGAHNAEMHKRFLEFLEKMPAKRPAELQQDYEKQLDELRKRYQKPIP